MTKKGHIDKPFVYVRLIDYVPHWASEKREDQENGTISTITSACAVAHVFGFSQADVQVLTLMAKMPP